MLPLLYSSTSLPPERLWWILLMISLYGLLFYGSPNIGTTFTILPVWELHINGIQLYGFFCDLHLPVNIILRFIDVAVCS